MRRVSVDDSEDHGITILQVEEDDSCMALEARYELLYQYLKEVFRPVSYPNR